MKIRLISYSAAGSATAARVAALLEARGDTCRRFAPEAHCADEKTEPLSVSAAQWGKEGFEEADALIYCCAAGIAVRSIAPWVKSKKTDPAVIVMDEKGKFVIPLLSGHIGGANELADYIAKAAGAVPVLTTATDINGLFAVDVFARRNHLYIESMTLAKEISAALLEGEKIGFCSDLPVKGELPPELTREKARIGICVTADMEKAPYEKTLRLVPRRYAAGIGCRRGKDAGEMEEFFLRQLEEAGVSVKEIRLIASVDLKKDEPGLLALSRKYSVPFETFTAQQLNSLPGSFSGSDFVKQTTGVDCVCERAALLAAGEGGKLVLKKKAGDGATFALAEYEEDISFE